MKITFCLPAPVIRASGGHKVVYEYANHLIKKNHEVCIAYDCSNAFSHKKIFSKIMHANNTITLFYYEHIYKKIRNWFLLDKNIKEIFCVNGVKDNLIENSDIVVATAVETAKPVAALSEDKGRKIYLVQGVENWQVNEVDLKNTYNLPFECILVVSKGIEKYIKEFTNTTIYRIPNGINLNDFYVKNPIHERYPLSVAMLYHKLECKGSTDGIKVLCELKNVIPDLKVSMFGVYKRPKDLPSWIQYTRNATKEDLLKIYNESAVFLCPSIEEGFGLTSIESMACGCALVTSDNLGAEEFAVHYNNAIVFQKGNVEDMKNCLLEILENNALRIQIAIAGNSTVQIYDWDTSTYKFEKIMKEIIK